MSTEKRICYYCHGTGKTEEYNSTGVMLGIAVFGAPIPLGGGYTVQKDCTYCNGTGER